MWMNCPHKWRSKGKVGKHITFEDRRVNVCAGVCDAADLCKIEGCEFYDITQEGTKKFMKALADEHGIEGLRMRAAQRAAASAAEK